MRVRGGVGGFFFCFIVSLTEQSSGPMHVHFADFLGNRGVHKYVPGEFRFNIWILTLVLLCTSVCDCSSRSVRMS